MNLNQLASVAEYLSTAVVVPTEDGDIHMSSIEYGLSNLYRGLEIELQECIDMAPDHAAQIEATKKTVLLHIMSARASLELAREKLEDLYKEYNNIVETEERILEGEV